MQNTNKTAGGPSLSAKASLNSVLKSTRPAVNAFAKLQRHCLAATCALVATVASVSHAAPVNYITNGSFEASGGSFSGWTTTGATSIMSTTFGAPTNGTFKAFISNSSGSVAASVLSDFFGGITLPSNAGGSAEEGSGIKQTFTLQQPATLSFDYRFLSQEDIGSSYDETFFVLDGNVTILADTDTAGVTPYTGLPLRYKNGIPYRTVSLELTAGTHTLGFGAYDTGDTSGDSAILLDNVQAVPEPGTAAFGIGLGLVSLLTRRARRARA